MSKKLPWFAARLLFEAKVSDEGKDPALFEERVVLVRSDSGIGGAEKKAKKMAASLADSYETALGETATWSFRELLDIVQLNEPDIHDGSEVYHHYLGAEEAAQIRQSLKAGTLS